MLPLPRPVFPGAIFPAVPQTSAAALLAVQFQLSRSERLPLEDLQALQFRQLDALVAHAAQVVPFYADRLREAGWRADVPITAETWSRIPLLTRSDVQDADKSLHAREMPQGHGQVGFRLTSGSSGRPVTIYKSALAIFYWRCFALREELWNARDFAATSMGISRDEALRPG